MVIMILSFGHLATSSYVFQRGFNKEAFDASRSTVFEAFFLDFNSTSDWIIGRGIEGTVLRAASTGDIGELIENGFLVVILKGGLLYLIPFLIILLRASYLGFYKSNNDLVKALAYLILIYIIIMFFFNIPSFTTKYIFLWISVSVCFTPEIRSTNNDEIFKKINS